MSDTQQPLYQEGRALTQDFWHIWQQEGYWYIFSLALILIAFGILIVLWKHGPDLIRAFKDIKHQRIVEQNNKETIINELRATIVQELRDQIQNLNNEIDSLKKRVENHQRKEIEYERKLMGYESKHQLLSDTVQRQAEDIVGLIKVKEYLRRQAVERDIKEAISQKPLGKQR